MLHPATISSQTFIFPTEQNVTPLSSNKFWNLCHRYLVQTIHICFESIYRNCKTFYFILSSSNGWPTGSIISFTFRCTMINVMNWYISFYFVLLPWISSLVFHIYYDGRKKIVTIFIISYLHYKFLIHTNYLIKSNLINLCLYSTKTLITQTVQQPSKILFWQSIV